MAWVDLPQITLSIAMIKAAGIAKTIQFIEVNALFDEYIKPITDYIDEIKAKGRQIRVFKSATSAVYLKEKMPIKVGQEVNQGIILQEDSFVELGNPGAGSCSFTLITNNLGLISDGRITLIGPDIPESPGQSLPFGQVVIVGGIELDHSDYEVIQNMQFISDQIEGYMIRSFSQNLWSRVSKDTARKGFCFETLGKALMGIYRSNNQKIEAIEVIFVTSNRQDVNLMGDIGTQVQKINNELVEDNWKSRGYDIDCSLDCSSCQDKSVCDDIKEVLRSKRSSQNSINH